MKKTIEILKMLLGFLIMIALFLLGLIDRIILAPLFWIDSPRLTSAEFYRTEIGFSLIRISGVAIIVAIGYLIACIF